MLDIPETMSALVTTGDGDFELKRIHVPRPSPSDVLLKVAAVAQNPTDWKTLFLHRQPGNVLGCDASGTVVQIGSDVTPGARKMGERVAAFVHGGISPNGAFAEYVVVPADLVIPIPATMSFEEGAQVALASFTACQCLYQTLQLRIPFALALDSPSQGAAQAEPQPTEILIWSGTSAVGQYAIQLAKLSGLHVVTTASPKNFDLVRSLGADQVFDYGVSKTPREITRATDGRLSIAMDCISQGGTPNQVSVSLSPDGGTIATLLPYTSRKKGVRTEFVLAYSIFGKAIEFPFSFPANPEHRRNAATYAKMISALLFKNAIKPVPVKLLPHGLGSVSDGFEYASAGKVHAEKLTYKIADTPGLATI